MTEEDSAVFLVELHTGPGLVALQIPPQIMRLEFRNAAQLEQFIQGLIDAGNAAWPEWLPGKLTPAAKA